MMISGHCRRVETGIAARRGSVHVEALLVIPVLFLATLAIVEFGLILLTEQAAQAASIEGARVAARSTATDADVAAAVQGILAVQQIPVAVGGARIDIERFDGISWVTTTLGDPAVPLVPEGPAQGALSTTDVRVTVAFYASTLQKPVPDWLNYVGVSIATSRFQVSTLATTE